MNEQVIDAIWNDGELRDAIVDYGEWNHQKLDEVFEKVKQRHLNKLTEGE